MSGKGSSPRPYSVPFERFDAAFDWAFWVMCKKCYYFGFDNVNGHCYMFKDKPINICAQFKEDKHVLESRRAKDANRL